MCHRTRGPRRQPSTHAEIGGFHYVLAGEGTVTIGEEKAPIKAGDAVAYNFNQTIALEAGKEPLELMAVGVVKDASRRIPIVGPSPYPAAGRGRGNAQ